jgi:tetratricopeptide (TPR) repeat protein
MKKNWFSSAPTAFLLSANLAVVAACGAPTVVAEDEDTEPELVELDIPGVVPAALTAYYDGVRAMRETPTNYVAAAAAFERAVAADPDFWEAMENLGLVQLDLGRYADAAATFRRELGVIDALVERGWPVEPRPAIYLSLGKALALGGDQQGAAQAFAALLEIDPQNVEARANLAALYYSFENYAAAREYISELLEMSRNEPGALAVLALIAKNNDDMQLATYLWQKTLGEISMATESLEDEDQYLGLEDDEADRLRAYNAARIDRLNKVLSDVQNELGILRAGEGEADAAELLFRLAVSNNPSNASAHANLGAVYLDYANFEDACMHFGETLALRPRDLTALLGNASCIYGLGDVDEAYARFEHALREYPNNAFVARRLGEVALSDLSDQEAALRWFGRNLQIRGMSPDTCSPREDRVCANYQSIIQMQQMMAPRDPAQ